MERAYSINDLAAVFRRRWKLLFIPILIAGLIGSVVAYILPPLYRSTATIGIESQEIPSEFVQSTVNLNIVEHVNDIRRVVMSTDSLARLARDLELFGAHPQMSDPELAAAVRERTDITLVDEDVVDPRTGRTRTAIVGFKIAYTDPDPTVARDVVARLAESFLEENRRSRTEQARETVEFLEREAEQLAVQVADFETRLAEFKRENAGFLPESQQLNLEFYERVKQEYQKEAAALRGLQERYRVLRQQVPTAVTSEQQTELQRLQAELQAAMAKYSEIHPDVVRLKRAIESEKKRVEEAGGDATVRAPNPAHNELLSLRAQINEAQGRLNTLEAEKAKYEQRLADSPEVEKQYLALSRGYENTLRKYRDIKDKLLQAKMAVQLEAAEKGQRFVLLEKPRRAVAPYFPNRPGIVLLSLMLGFVFGIVLAGVAEMRDRSIHGPEDIVAILDTEPMGTIPYIQNIANDGGKNRAWKASMVAAGILVLAALFAIHAYVVPFDQLLAQIWNSREGG